MPGKLPDNFDPKRYLDAYPDVALTGMDPAQHYLRFGKLMGRSPNGNAGALSPERAAPKPPKPPQQSEKAPRPSATAEPDGAEEKPPTIIDRPADFDPQEVIPAPAPPKTGGDENGVFTLDTLGTGLEIGGGAIAAYARIFDPGARAQPPAPQFLGQRPFVGGMTRIENAWFAGESRVRLMISGADQSEGEASHWALRAYQADPASPGDLRLAGAGLRLPATGPAFHELELLNPLMPLLLEIENMGDGGRSIALMPFPSLLPGGLHSVELRALQAEPNPMDAFWSLSELLLSEFFGPPDASLRSITAVRDSDGGHQDAGLADLPAWLTCVFGISNSAGKRSGGITLELPADCVPTISALVSRRLGTGSRSIGPFLVAEPASYRPRWSVVLPADWDAGPNVPAIEGKGAARGTTTESRQPPVHLAIALRPAPEASLPRRDNATEAAKARRGGLKLTVVLDTSDAKRTGAVASSLQSATAARGLELLVRMPDANVSVRETLNETLGVDGWAPIAANLRLPEIASNARHERLLTISDRVVLDDPRVLKGLAALLRDDDKAASASCVLLAEASIKKQAVLQPASGGLFPTGVSFATSPSLTFGEPDVLQALPDLTYPVVANRFQLTMWRKEALAQLPRTTPFLPPDAEDIYVGLALLKAGFRNLCTTKQSARLSGRHARRDVIDPVGQPWIHPQDWEQLLARVTLLRQLF
jgi:hypothetical protein